MFPGFSTDPAAFTHRWPNSCEITVTREHTSFYARTLGRYWIFAYNGNLPSFNPSFSGHFLSVGDPDSENVFCWLLDQLQIKFDKTQLADDLLFAELHAQ